jgi:hypothetical protein
MILVMRATGLVGMFRLTLEQGLNEAVEDFKR